ncbi:hypothetical protein C8Q80DRAFT_429739 [Daedaleopsis nitida]|nr:hypothetical protein C8Q80DRAFT_429739 [Daedaleopsis nitida]
MPSFSCVICLETFSSITHPMVTTCGHAYCLACATAHFNNTGTSPNARVLCGVCRAPQTFGALIRLYPDWDRDGSSEEGRRGDPKSSDQTDAVKTGGSAKVVAVGDAKPAGSEKAKALYTYTASPDDPSELSFVKGAILEIMDKSGQWWQARKADGTSGIVPSNYIVLIEPDEPGAAASTGSGDLTASSSETDTDECNAKALYNYTASPDDPNEISFTKGEILKVRNRSAKWWRATKDDGTEGIVPSNYMQLVQDDGA